MTSTQEAPSVASAPKVHEFTTDLMVHRRHAAANAPRRCTGGPAGVDLPPPGTPVIHRPRRRAGSPVFTLR